MQILHRENPHLLGGGPRSHCYSLHKYDHVPSIAVPPPHGFDDALLTRLTPALKSMDPDESTVRMDRPTHQLANTFRYRICDCR